MARLSIDDSIGRDSRLDHLAMLCGWTKRETMGCLQLDIWPLCYDRVTPNIPQLDLEIAAGRNAVTPIKHQGGFVGALIESKMGRPATKADRSFEWRPKGWKEGDPVITIEWPDQEFRDRVYITGAAERIAYIAKSRTAGAIGGRKSAETRSKQSKQPSKGRLSDPPSDPGRVPQGVVNPSATPSASAVPSVSALAVAPSESPPPVATNKAKSAKVRPPIPPEAETAARRLLDRISTNTPASTLARLPESAKLDRARKWAEAFRLLHERDGHSWEDITAMVDWCQADPFWKSNILSGDKLREKWDQLAAKRSSSVDGYDVRYGRARLPSPEEYEQEDDPFGERTPKPAVAS
jgi:hypothetical protein